MDDFGACVLITWQVYADQWADLSVFLSHRHASLQTLWGLEINEERVRVWEVLVTGLSISGSLCSTPWSLTKLRRAPVGGRISAWSHTVRTWHRHAHTLSDTLLSRQVYKTFNCKLFYAGDNPWAYLPSKGIFCGQLEDESQRNRNNRTRKNKGRDPVH